MCHKESITDASCSFSLSRVGASQCDRSRCWSELWLRLEQCDSASRRRWWSLHQTGWWQSPRGQQQQIQHILWLHSLRRLNIWAQRKSSWKERNMAKGKWKWRKEHLTSQRFIYQDLSIASAHIFTERDSVERGFSSFSFNHLIDW